MKRYEMYWIDFNPAKGTQPGKVRPAVIIQSNLLNDIDHSSTLVCPLSTIVEKDTEPLRVWCKRGNGGLKDNCDILIDQIIAIDNKRIKNKIGVLPTMLQAKLNEYLKVVLDLE